MKKFFYIVVFLLSIIPSSGFTYSPAEEGWDGEIRIVQRAERRMIMRVVNVPPVFDQDGRQAVDLMEEEVGDQHKDYNPLVASIFIHKNQAEQIKRGDEVVVTEVTTTSYFYRSDESSVGPMEQKYYIFHGVVKKLE